MKDIMEFYVKHVETDFNEMAISGVPNVQRIKH